MDNCNFYLYMYQVCKIRNSNWLKQKQDMVNVANYALFNMQSKYFVDLRIQQLIFICSYDPIREWRISLNFVFWWFSVRACRIPRFWYNLYRIYSNMAVNNMNFNLKKQQRLYVILTNSCTICHFIMILHPIVRQGWHWGELYYY